MKRCVGWFDGIINFKCHRNILVSSTDWGSFGRKDLTRLSNSRGQLRSGLSKLRAAQRGASRAAPFHCRSVPHRFWNSPIHPWIPCGQEIRACVSNLFRMLYPEAMQSPRLHGLGILCKPFWNNKSLEYEDPPQNPTLPR